MPGLQRALLAQGVMCGGLNKLSGPAEQAALLTTDTRKKGRNCKKKINPKRSCGMQSVRGRGR